MGLPLCRHFLGGGRGRDSGMGQTTSSGNKCHSCLIYSSWQKPQLSQNSFTLTSDLAQTALLGRLSCMTLNRET